MKKDALTKILSISGTLLTGIPVVAPLIFAIISLVSGNGFLFDYMMPAELFIVVLVGAALLIWAAIRAKKFIKPFAWIFGISLILLFGCQGIAEISGLGNGDLEAYGPVFVIVVGMLILYDLGVASLTVLGGFLAAEVFSFAQ